MTEEKNNTDLQGPKKLGNPALVPGCKTLNPLGRPKKEVSTSAKTKEDLFKAFQQAGGLQRVVRLIAERKLGKTKESRSKAAQADKLFLELAFNVIPRMVPKETTLDVETRSVIFQFTNMAPETIQAKTDKGDVIDIEFTKEA